MGLGYEAQVTRFRFEFCGADVGFALGILGFCFAYGFSFLISLTGFQRDFALILYSCFFL
jgi:hypothetical protein